MRSIRPEERDFALCFARTLSIPDACAAAGFDRRTSFARARRLLDRDDVRTLVRAAIVSDSPDGNESSSVSSGVDVTFSGSSVENAILFASHGGDTTLSGSPGRDAPPSASPDGTALHPGSLDPLASRSAESPAIPDRALPAPDGAIDVSASEPPCVRSDVPPTDADGDLPESGDALAQLELSEGRIMREYEKIAFADASKDGDVKIADKLRALEAYRAIVERRAARAVAADGASGAAILTVNYDYGDAVDE